MIQAQVVIIGGGVMGVSLLYHLAKAGWKDLLLLEKNDLTHGSTWHAAGLCTHFAHNATVQELRATSVRLYRDILPEETGLSCGFHRSGAMRITRNPDRMDEFKHVAGLSEFTGYPLEVLTLDRIAELYPYARLDGLLGGIYEPDDGHVDPSLATNAMANVAVTHGASIQRQSAVKAIRHEQAHWIVETEKDAIQTTHVVNAAGTWGFEVGQMMGMNIPSVPVLHQYLVTEDIPAIKDRQKQQLPELPIIRDPEESWYVRQERQGLILGPYEKQAEVWSVDKVPPEFGADLFPADLDRVEPIIEAALARVPMLAEGGIKKVINGPITFTPDANPLIGPTAGLSNAWCLTGSSMGVMEGGGAGKFLAYWMTHGAPPMDALAIDSRRFGKWADRNYRVEKAVECFGLQFGVHYPFEERAAGRNIRVSPLHELMLERGAVMGVAYGKERPNWFDRKYATNGNSGANAVPRQAVDTFRRADWFDAVKEEINTATNAVALADLSVFSKFSITGPDTIEFINTLGTNTTPAAGRIGLTYVLTSEGGVQSEMTVALVNDSHAYLNSAAAAEEIDFALLAQNAASFDVTLTNQSDETAVIGIMGPASKDVLNTVTKGTLNKASRWLDVQYCDIADIQVLTLQVSYIGELGWELHVPATGACTVFKALEKAGEKYGLSYYGAYAANSMRLEKGYRSWGADLTTERTPFEAGLDRFVRTEHRNFVGKEAMLKRNENSKWQLVLLEIQPNTENINALTNASAVVDPFYAHPVKQVDRPVGIVTSGAYGHRCQKSLALAYLRDVDTYNNLTIEILGKPFAAQVLETVPFDPDNSRMLT